MKGLEMKNNIIKSILALLLVIFFISAVLGISIALYKKRGMIKNLIQSRPVPKFVMGKSNNSEKINPAETETKNQEIIVNIEPAHELRKISKLLYGTNLAPKAESETDIIQFVKTTGITCFRFPGGDSPGYHWKTGSFDFMERYKSVPLRNLDYLIEFCKLTNTKLIIQVNVESGNAKEAAGWVEYMNKVKQFPVQYWELGNEVYGDWDKAFMDGAAYAQLIKRYALAMKNVDPNIKIGVDWAPMKSENFNIAVVKAAGEYIDFVSCHWYPNHIKSDHKYEERIHPTAEEVMGNYLQIPKMIDRVKQIFEVYSPRKKDNVEVTFLEWDGAWDGPSSDAPPYSQGIAQWSLANAIFYADCLGQFAKSGVTVSNHYDLQSIGFGLIRGWDKEAGWGGQRWDGELVRPKALAIQLFSKYFGDVFIETNIENTPFYYKEQDWWADSYSGNVSYISCYASKFSNAKKISIVIINKEREKTHKVRINIASVQPRNEANYFVLTGPDLMAENEGNPGNVKIKTFKVTGVSKGFFFSVPPRSINLLEIEYD